MRRGIWSSPPLLKGEPIYGGDVETRKVLCHGLTISDPPSCQSEALLSRFEGFWLSICFAVAGRSRLSALSTLGI